VLWARNITPPHIAAGANLAFFPLGKIFRRSGAFFLRRSFRDDALYAATFRAYVTELVRTGTSIEFFPEGTRSRTGKLLPPKFGLLSMIVEAWRKYLRTDVFFVPVSIDYERIIEAGAYHKELSGEKKEKENIGGLIKTTSVLRSRYGRVQVQFGTPISLEHFSEQYHLQKGEDGDEHWRPGITRLGYHIMHGVAAACSVTPTSIVSTALLGHRGRGIAERSLLALCENIAKYLTQIDARLTLPLQSEHVRSFAILEAVRKLVDDKLVVLERAGRNDIEPIYRVPEDHRVILDFHKNAVMNYFATSSILARSLRQQSADYDTLRVRCQFLSRLFKSEFIYPAQTTFEENFNSALATLEHQGFLARNNHTISIVNKPAISLLSGLIDSFVQGYWVSSLCLRDLRAFPLWRKELTVRCLERGRRAFLEGTITRPEAVNRTLVDNAIDWLRDHAMIRVVPVGKKQNVTLHPACSEQQFEEFISELGGYL
jgi:glycerol-3-phosphate O-acyltransferase